MNVEKILEIYSAIDLDGEWLEKIHAFRRYSKNHSLVARIFSPQVLGEVGSIVTEIRLQAMKKQANSLLSYKLKLDKDIVELEKKHAAKRKTFSEKCEMFEEECKRIRIEKPFPDAEYEEQLAEKYYQQLKSAKDEKQNVGPE